jgi:hypothetical protein
MKIEIDQSGKIENTAQSSVIADSIGNAIKISARNKRLIQQMYRQTSKPNEYVYHLFSLVVGLVIKKTYSQEHLYIIDTEYYGKDDYLRGLILLYMSMPSSQINKHKLIFRQIGRKSQAHTNAYTTFKNIKNKVQVQNLRLKTVIKQLQ